MKPAEAAKMLADLNWSGMPTPHQIAVSAALETLKGLTEPDPRKLAMSSAYGNSNERFKPAEFQNVVALPVPPRTRWTRLYHLDGRIWSSASHFGPEGAWGWVLETVAHEHGVSEDQISSAESDETQPYDCDDLVLIDGLPVYRLRHVAK
jgi:hypothetical protein